MCPCSMTTSTGCAPTRRPGSARCCWNPAATPQARSERESFSQMYSEDLAKYDAAENGLCFGRIDLDDAPAATRPRTRRAPLHRAAGHSRRGQRLRIAAAGLAGPAGPAVLPGHHRLARGRDAAQAHPHPQPPGHRGQRRIPRPRRGAAGGLRGRRRRRSRGRAVGGAQRRPHRAHERHRRDHSVRTRRHHPVGAQERARGAGRPRHRQDRRGPAPRGVPALHLPQAAGQERCADHRPQRDLPRLHRPGAARARGDRRAAVDDRRPLPRREGAPPGFVARGPDQGLPRHPGGAAQRRARPAGTARPAGGAAVRRLPDHAGPQDRQQGPWPGAVVASPAQPGAPDLPDRRDRRARRTIRGHTGRTMSRAARTCSRARTSPTSAAKCAPTPTSRAPSGGSGRS